MTEEEIEGQEPEEEFDEDEALREAGLEEQDPDLLPDPPPDSEPEEPSSGDNEPEPAGPQTIEEAQALIADLERAKAGLTNDLVDMREARRNERIRLDSLEAKLDRLNQGLMPVEESDEVEPPDPNEDPIGAIAHGQQATQQQVAQLSAAMQQRQVAEFQQHYIGKVNESYEQVKDNLPGIDKAIEHQRSVRRSVIEAQTEGALSDEQIDQILDQETLSFYDRFWNPQTQSFTRNPIEALYQLSVKGYKFDPNSVPEPEGGDEPPTDDIAKKKQAIADKQRRVQQSKSVAKGGGATGKRWLTLDDVAEMTDDQVDELLQGQRGTLLERLEVEGKVPLP